MSRLNRPIIVLAFLAASVLPIFAQEGGSLEIVIEPTPTEKISTSDLLADLSAEERESLLTKASIEAGYGEPYPASDPEAMAVIYDYAYEMLAASNTMAREELEGIPGDVTAEGIAGEGVVGDVTAEGLAGEGIVGDVTAEGIVIKETGEIVPPEEMIYTVTGLDSPTLESRTKNGGSVGGDVDIKNRFGRTVRALARALRMYDLDRRAGIGRELSHEVQAMLHAIKMYDAEMGRLTNRKYGSTVFETADPTHSKRGIVAFDRAMIAGTETTDLVFDIRETTTGLDVEYRLYGPGAAHWGSARFTSACVLGGSKELQAWWQECASGKNIRKNITATKVDWANVVIEKEAVQGDTKWKEWFDEAGKKRPLDEPTQPDLLVRKMPGRTSYASLTLGIEGSVAVGISGGIPNVVDLYAAERAGAADVLSLVSDLLRELAVRTGNETLLDVAAAVAQERVKLRQGTRIGHEVHGVFDWAITDAEARVVQPRAGTDRSTIAHEAAHVVQQRTADYQVWNQPITGLITVTGIPVLTAHEAAHVAQQRRYSVEQYVAMWEKEQGRRMTATGETTLSHGARGDGVRAVQETKKGLNAVNVKLARSVSGGGILIPQVDTVTNVQKSKHDAAMAAIQNTR
ncbi:MAG: hypothetical protein HYY93_16995 [Planctomycetes bacterium]|nr:hypothetical protein [Planctomycetota bacterium]